HVMIGNYEAAPSINPEEVANWKWMKPEDVKNDISKNPETYTAWFKIIFERFYNHLIQTPQ
ncbi:MAG: isopentenyl-diphosphate Delta-isomerase, partial [Flavobacteriales bacterium]